MRAYRRGPIAAAVVVVLVIAAVTFTRRWTAGDDAPVGEPAVAASGGKSAADGASDKDAGRSKPKAKIVSMAEREDAIRRAAVWREPAVPVTAANLGANPETPRSITCRFRVTELGGTTPKFDCNLENGDPVRIKYGRTGELPGEVATTRLLRALGFASDTVDYVENVRCYGCPKEPFSTMKAVEITQAEQLYKKMMLSYESYEEFEWATLESKFPDRAIEAEKLAGWNMFELTLVDPSKGGAPRAHVDALRLLTVFLAHWDNKPDNQRIVCLSQEDWKDGERCEKPLLLLQDVGATFGPHKVNLDNWKEAPIWEDRASCRTSMKDLPYDGATFGDAINISEEGRQFLGKRLASLSDSQLSDLFSGARFDGPIGFVGRGGAVLDWVQAFKTRVRLITEGPKCAT